MKNLVQEIHGRSMWQVAGLYLAFCWLVLQVSQTLTEGLGLPDWVVPFALILLLIGFPIVLATAFLQRGFRSRKPEPEPQSLDEVGEVAPTMAPVPGAARVLTWRRALLGGVMGFVLLATVAAAWAVTRTMGFGPAATLVSSGVLDETDRIVLADFDDRTGDPDLALSVTEALRVDLGQSRGVRLANESLISEARDRMEMDPAASLDEGSARQLAQREGLAAVVAGEVSRVGDGYLLVARVVTPAGEVLLDGRETAADPGDLLGAIDELSKNLRERIGESLREIRAEPPLEAVTTSNLEALRLYSLASKALGRAEYDLSLPQLEQAVALDTAFAAAYRKLGVALGNLGEQRARRTEALTRAYAHRDRLTARERYMAIASYHVDITGDDEQALAAYEAILAIDPSDIAALNNSGIILFQQHAYPPAIERYESAFRSDPSSTLPITNVLYPLAMLGRLDEAEGWVDTLVARFPESLFPNEYYGHLAWLRRDYDRAEGHMLAMLERVGTIPFWRAYAIEKTGHMQAAMGRLAEAEQRLGEAQSIQLQRDLPGEYIESALEMGWIDLGVRADTTRALARLNEALVRFPWEQIEPRDRPYFSVADYYAIAGFPDSARVLLDEFAAVMPADEVEGAQEDIAFTRAAIAVAEGRFDEAIPVFRRLDGAWGCRLCAVMPLADAYDRAGARDSAIAVYQRYLDTNWLQRSEWDASLLGPVYERLGELYLERDQLPEARASYTSLLDLWAEADAELIPRLQRARDMVSEIDRRAGEPN